LQGYCDFLQYYYGGDIRLSADEIITRKTQYNTYQIGCAYPAGVNTAARSVGILFKWRLSHSELEAIPEEDGEEDYDPTVAAGMDGQG